VGNQEKIRQWVQRRPGPTPPCVQQSTSASTWPAQATTATNLAQQTGMPPLSLPLRVGQP